MLKAHYGVQVGIHSEEMVGLVENEQPIRCSTGATPNRAEQNEVNRFGRFSETEVFEFLFVELASSPDWNLGCLKTLPEKLNQWFWTDNSPN